MRCGLASEDQLYHVALYQWLVEQGQFERLLSVRSPFLEDFLVRGTKKHPESIVMFDLLWKFYEKTKSYPAAAKILSKLADRHRCEIQKIFFAVMRPTFLSSSAPKLACSRGWSTSPAPSCASSPAR